MVANYSALGYTFSEGPHVSNVGSHQPGMPNDEALRIVLSLLSSIDAAVPLVRSGSSSLTPEASAGCLQAGSSCSAPAFVAVVLVAVYMSLCGLGVVQAPRNVVHHV